MQLDLGIGKIDETETRRAVRDYFKLYRMRKTLLEMQGRPEMPPQQPMKGYGKAMDPQYIHANRVHPQTPMDEHLDPDDKRVRFVWKVEHSVRCLPEYRGEIIKRCFMVKETPGKPGRLPSDTEVHEALRSIGWTVGVTYYYEEKEAAIMTLAEAWGLIKLQQ